MDTAGARRFNRPRVVPRLAVCEANDFGLDHDPALVVPRAGSVAGVGIDVRGLATDLALRAGHLHGGLRMPLQHRVLRHRHDVVEPGLRIQKIEDLRGRKAPVEPNEKPRPRKRRP